MAQKHQHIETPSHDYHSLAKGLSQTTIVPGSFLSPLCRLIDWICLLAIFLGVFGILIAVDRYSTEYVCSRVFCLHFEVFAVHSDQSPEHGTCQDDLTRYPNKLHFEYDGIQSYGSKVMSLGFGIGFNLRSRGCGS